MTKIIKKRTGINYMGNKHRFLDDIHSKLEIKEGDKVLDLFGGSGIVGANIKQWYPSTEVTYNDWDNKIFGMVKSISMSTVEEYNNNIAEISKQLKKPSNHTKLYKEDKQHPEILEFKKNWKDFFRSKKLEEYTDWEKIYLINSSFRSTLGVNKQGIVNDSAGSKNMPIMKENPLSKIDHFISKDFNDINFNDYDVLYLDPPYTNAVTVSQYGKYEEEGLDYNLLEKLKDFKGKFIINNYDNPIYNEYAEKCNWNIELLNKTTTLSGKSKVVPETTYWN